MIEKLKKLFNDYGLIAVVIHFSIFFTCWISFYIALNAGLDLADLDWLPEIIKKGGNIAIAYGITQALKIPRIAVTILLTPIVGNFILKHRRSNGESNDLSSSENIKSE